MVERVLHIGNVAACVAAAAGFTYAGGAATLISAALSGTALWSQLCPEERTLAQEMAKALEQHLRQSHLTPDRRKITAQVLARFPPGLDDMAQGDMEATTIAEAMCDLVRKEGTDPAYRTDQALDDYARALRAILPPLLAPRDRMEAMQQELLRRTQVSGEAQTLQAAGISEKAIVTLARRIAGGTEDVNQAWTELQNAMQIAEQVQREGRARSNQGEFVDAVLARVAELVAEGDYAGAGDTVAKALAEEDAAHQARKSRLLDSGAEVAMLEGDAATAADYLIRKADLDAGGQASVNTLWALRESYHEKGRDTGTALDLEIAIALARRIHDRSTTPDDRGWALNDLAASLAILGDRESGTARLEESVRACRAALKEQTRDRVPLQWAMTQMNLGNALLTLGERESGTARLEAAVTAYRDALKERTRDWVPLDWAMVQANLASLETAFFDKTDDTARLDRAEEFARAAKEVFDAVQASQYVQMADKILAAIAARRGGGWIAPTAP